MKKLLTSSYSIPYYLRRGRSISRYIVSNEMEAQMLYPPDPRLHVTLARDRGERVAAELEAARGAGPGLLRRAAARLLLSAAERLAPELRPPAPERLAAH
jgi:hypothetical protein